MTIHSTSEWLSVLHPNFCEAISNLSSLERLAIHLDPGRTSPVLASDLSMATPTTTSTTSTSLVPTSETHSSCLNSSSFVSVDLVWTRVLALNENEELYERGAAFFCDWTLLSNIAIDEEAGIDYDEDCRPGDKTADNVWKGGLKAFSPDPVLWVERDLNLFTNRHGRVVPMEEISQMETSITLTISTEKRYSTLTKPQDELYRCSRSNLDGKNFPPNS
ncbi:hypothetical protein KCU64_g94, partial [Aureobasidium melanogenum]